MSVVMDEAEVAAFLGQTRTATIISINPSGMPLPAPVWFANDGSDVMFSTMRKTQKAKNLLRDPRCVVQVEAGEAYAELRAVILTGTAREATEAEAALFNERRNAKYSLGGMDRGAVPAATLKHYDNPRIVFRVTPERVKSWDNRKLRAKTAP